MLAIRPIFHNRVWLLTALLSAVMLPQAAQAEKKLLRLRFSGPIHEQPQGQFDLSAVFSGEPARTLREWTRTIDDAAADRDVAGMVMIVEDPSMNVAQLEELSRSLKSFRDKGKKIWAYLDSGSNLTYALASCADRVSIAENGDLSIVGLHSELSFYKNLLSKIGVEADMLHCGSYKAALEPFTRTEPSKEFAENINWLLDGIFDRWVRLIAENRHLTPEQVKSAIDQAPFDSKKALELKLVDSIESWGDFRQALHKEYGKDVKVLKKMEKENDIKLDFDNPFAMFQLFGKLRDAASDSEKPGIALIYIDGPISMGRSERSLLGGSSVGSTTIRAAFEKAREDENVKAVVVRVDSPGGSASASDIMWEAATRCAKEKPLIVSMGGVAGSGGYYVSIPGDTIFAEEGTITASIGVVGGKFVWSTLMEEKLGITTTEFQRGAHAGMMSFNHKWSEPERQFMMTYMNDVYDQFKGRIRQSRGDRIKGKLEDMAEGRVFTGKQALERGLIDRIGGLNDAMKYAAEKAGLKDRDYAVHILPKPMDLADLLKQILGEDTQDEFEVKSGWSLSSDPVLGGLAPMLQQLSPARHAAILNDLRNASMLNREHVGCFMPFSGQIR